MENTSMRSAIAYSPVALHPNELGLLAGGDLGPLAVELAAGAGDGHALVGAHLQKADLDFGEYGQHVEEHLGHGSDRVRVLLPAASCCPYCPRNFTQHDDRHHVMW
jgi:hypothetical protein